MSIRERNCCNEKRQPAPHSVLQIRVPATLPAHQCHRLAKVLAAHGPRLTGGSFDPNKLPGEVQSQSQAEARALEQAEAQELARVRAQPQEPFHMSMELYGEVSGSQRLELDVKKAGSDGCQRSLSGIFLCNNWCLRFFRLRRRGMIQARPHTHLRIGRVRTGTGSIDRACSGCLSQNLR